MFINVRETMKAMKEAYKGGHNEWYNAAYKLLHTAWNLGLISYDDFDKVVKQDSKLFEEANAEEAQQ